MHLINELHTCFNRNEQGIFINESVNGYWSNLSKEENSRLIGSLTHLSTKEAIVNTQPQLEDIIFSPKRSAGLELLDLKGDEICIDYGCMWGALTIPLAKRSAFVLGIDQTMDSLCLLMKRAEEERLDNCEVLCADLNQMPLFENKADIAIVNGVLEWIPSDDPIELKNYYGKYKKKNTSANPLNKQKCFLKNVFRNLKDRGKLYLAIENRYDFKMFLGANDPHANLLFTSFLPRKCADLISASLLGRPYVNWLYSFEELQRLLQESGFSRIGLYMCFPDYRFPGMISPYNGTFENFKPTISLKNSRGKKTWKRYLARAAEAMIFEKLKMRHFAPSIIAIAYK